jgi:hypothetical protein
MRPVVDPNRAVVGGTAVVMACACGTSAQAAKVVALVGIGATTRIVHPIFVGIGAALILYGLWNTRRESGVLGAVAFAVLAVAAALTPASVMSTVMSDMHGSLPWNAVQMLGGALYVVAGAILAYAFWRAFPARNPAASATAIGGMTLATGCACCLVSGAVAGMAVTAGASATYMENLQLVYWTGLAAVTVGLYRLAGPRGAAWALGGGLVARVATGVVLARTPGVTWLQFPKYLIAVAGTLAMAYGFVVAYRAARVGVPAATRAFAPTASGLGIQASGD